MENVKNIVQRVPIYIHKANMSKYFKHISHLNVVIISVLVNSQLHLSKKLKIFTSYRSTGP